MQTSRSRRKGKDRARDFSCFHSIPFPIVHSHTTSTNRAFISSKQVSRKSQVRNVTLYSLPFHNSVHPSARRRYAQNTRPQKWTMLAYPEFPWSVVVLHTKKVHTFSLPLFLCCTLLCPLSLHRPATLIHNTRSYARDIATGDAPRDTPTIFLR